MPPLGMARPRAKLDRCGEADLVRRRRHTEPPGARRERLLAVQMGLQGELGLDRIAQAVGRARATIQTWFDTYRQGGVDALLYDARRDNPGRPSELSGAALAEFAEGSGGRPLAQRAATPALAGPDARRAAGLEQPL